MTDEKLETGIEAIQAMLAARDAGSQANVIDAVPESLALPAPWSAKRKKRKSDETDVGQSVGSDAEGTSSQALSMAIGGLPLGGIGPMPAGPQPPAENLKFSQSPLPQNAVHFFIHGTQI